MLLFNLNKIGAKKKFGIGKYLIEKCYHRHNCHQLLVFNYLL